MTSKTFEDPAYRHICSEKTLQSNSQGFFLDFANYVAKEAGNVWIKTVFGKLKTDMERIKCIYTSNETRDTIRNFFSNVQEVYRPKNADISNKKRLEADNFMQQKDFQKAVALYSQSILRAPKTGKSYSLALWGRAQALIKQQKFSKAIPDLKEALKEHLPESCKAGVFLSMAICYKAIGEENRANISFNLAEKLLLKQNQEELIRVKESVFVDRSPVNQGNIKRPHISDGDGVDIPNSSKKLSLKMSENMGRYITANQTIASGETLVVEPPYAACLLPDMFGTHCHHCFKTLESPFGCTECASVAFCTLDCRDQALSTYHRYECKYLDLLIGSGMSILAHAALRMVTQLGLEKCLELHKNRAKERIFQLCTNAHLRPAEDFLQRTLMAGFLLTCLQKSSFFGCGNGTRSSTHSPSDAEYQIGEMLLFNLQVLQFNAHEVYETVRGPQIKFSKSKTRTIGIAVYLTASLFNHECHPALSRHFVGKDIVLTSIRPIEANVVVPENYGPIFTRMNLAQRQRALTSRYWFHCKCLACQENWPCLGKGLEDVSKRLRCPTESCKQIFTLPIVRDVECNTLQALVNISDKILLLKQCEEQYQEASNLMDKNQVHRATDLLLEAINTFYRISLPPNKEIHLAEEALGTCKAEHGNTWTTPNQ